MPTKEDNMDDTELRDDLARSLEPPPDDDAAPMDALDEDRANRLLYKLRRVSRERAQIQAVARAERDRVDAWERDRLDVVDRQITDLTNVLEQWMRMHSERTKSVTKTFPNGELRLRAARARLEIIDDAKAEIFVMERVQTAVAKAIAQPNFRTDASSGDVFALVLRALRDEPFLRVKLDLAKDAVKKAAEEGPVTSEHDDVEMRAAVVDGEAIPGVLFEKSRIKSFGMTLATAAGPDDDQGADELEEVNRG
jgi:uncharacterized protein (DUF885 family)